MKDGLLVAQSGLSVKVFACSIVDICLGGDVCQPTI